MEKERSSIGTTNYFHKGPKMFVIKGRQQDHNPIPVPLTICEIRKFIRIKETTTFYLRLPLDSFLKRIIKRSVDVFLSTIVITFFLSWLVPLVAILIKLNSKGPVFFLQKRNGKDGKIFTCIKFRSMMENDEADELPAAHDDERITRFGSFLRDHKLDNVPQFFNVWWGDMSVIGPRPQMITVNNKYEDLIEFYEYRHKVKPGITGLSQVMGRTDHIKNLRTMKDHLQLDIFYVRYWSFSLDIKILWHSIRKLLSFSSTLTLHKK